MTKTFSFLALGLLAGQAFAQTRPGGPGGPPAPQGSWVLQFKGQVYDQDGNLVWSRDQYAAHANDDTREVVQKSDANGVPGIGSDDVAYVHGSISVRRQWVGSGTPTPAPNFRIHSVAQALAVFIPSATANNGFESQSSPNGSSSAVADDLELIQPGENSDGETTVSFSTQGEKADFFVGAAFDSRYARASHAGQTFRKGNQISTTSYSFTTTDGTTRTWTVPTFERILNVPDASSQGTATLRADIGLPLMSYRLGPTESVLTSVGFLGEAAWIAPGTSWAFTVAPDELGDSISGVCQSSDPLSVSLGASVVRPQIKTLNQGGKLEVDYISGDADTIGLVTLDVKWPDGLKAQGRVSAHYYPEAKYIRAFDTFGDPDKESPVDQLTSDGKDLVTYQTDAYETGGTQGSVGFKVLDASLSGISIALSAWQPGALPYVVALAAANKALDAAGPWAEPEKFTYNRNDDVLNPQDMIPGTVYTSYDWIGTIRPETLYTPHEVELYNMEGFLYHDLVLQTQVDQTRGKRAIRIYPRSAP